MMTTETTPHQPNGNSTTTALKDQHLQADYASTAASAAPATTAVVAPTTSFDLPSIPPRRTFTTSTHSPTTTVATAAITTGSSVSAVTALQRGRTYRISTTGGATNKWVTRELAALDFLLNIPMEAEQTIIHNGWLLQQQHDEFYEQRGNSIPRVLAGRNTPGMEEMLEEAKQPEDEAVLEPPPSSHGGRWWEKLVGDSLISSNKRSTKEGGEAALDPSGDPQALGEGPLQPPQSNNNNNDMDQKGTNTTTSTNKDDLQVVPLSVPSRRLDGDEAFFVQIPLKVDTMTRQRSIARQAAIREWEKVVAYGVFRDANNVRHRQQPPMLDGRMFFSAAGSYPVGVFSVLRYEKRKEEEARLRQKLEARGGGGTQFAVPERDWRGTSYRALLPRVAKHHSSFHRSLQQQKKKRQTSKDHDGDDSDDDNDDDSSVSSTSSSEASDTYVPGFLDDPEMIQGRHRNLMIGDRHTGCIIVSTIQFVEPALLKADLNKQFRERFESWEPPKSQRKYIGARFMDGVYTLMDTTEEQNHSGGVSGGSASTNAAAGDRSSGRRSRQSSVAHVGGGGGGSLFEEIRMPPSLTLSKIRSVKQQALLAAVKAKLEISTVALACIYFERLCLDCRVDKSNRRLCFASCILLSMKINEAYVGLVTPGSEANDDGGRRNSLHSLIRTTNKSQTMFASLLEFFTQDWQLSLKQLFAAEWGVFAALGFSLHANPSHVAFHFKRLMKTLEWNIVTYLGRDMYGQWQDVLEDEESRRRSRERRRELRRKRKEKNLIALQRELQVEADRRERRLSDLHKSGWNQADDDTSQPEEVSSPIEEPTPSATSPPPSKDRLSSTTHHKNTRIKLFNRLSMKKSASQGKLHTPVDDRPQEPPISFVEAPSRRKRLSLSPSMPLFSTITQPNTPPQGTIRHVSIDVKQNGEDSELMSDEESDAGIIV